MKCQVKSLLLMCQRKQSYEMTCILYRHFHAKHLRVSKMYPGLQGNLLSENVDKSKNAEETDSACHSQKLMLHHRLIYSGAPGTYTLLPMMTRSLEKLQKIIDQEMQGIGAQKITMPCLATGAMWKKSNRWDIMGSELLKLKDRQEKDLCLAPTHEEAVTMLVAVDTNLSRLKLPVKLYQIGRKFRDEMRPKHGLLRCREFEMKDLYTFDVGPEEATETYDEVCDAYGKIFTTLGLDVLKVEADTGAMGGSKSHEFHLKSSIGEDRLLHCPQCGKCLNEELGNALQESKKCRIANCTGVWEEITGIEVAHAFILGTKYSEIFKARVRSNESNRVVHHYMGCYGIGVTRLLSAAAEVLSTEEDLRWPNLLAPHQICIIPQQTGYHFEESLAIATSLQEELLSKRNLANEVILDDRFKLSLGRRLKICQHFGFPYIVVVGKKAQENPPMLELHDTRENNKQLLTPEQIVNKLSDISTIVV